MDCCAGQPFPTTMFIQVTHHARKRLVERFPEHSFTPAEANKVLIHLVRESRILSSSEAKSIFRGTGWKSGHLCWIPDLPGIAVVKFRDDGDPEAKAIVITVIPMAERIRGKFRNVMGVAS